MSGLLKLKAVSSLWSDVWDHFEKGEKTAKCKHCDRELSFCGGTTNLRDHLLRNHTKEYQVKKDSDESKRKIDEFVLKTTCSSTRARKITQLLVDMVAMDARPTATVEGTGFKRLLNYLEPGYKVPSAVHITSCLHERYSQVKGVVMEYLQSASYIALTSDVWTSLATQSYISATAHFVTSEWELNSCVLQTLHFPESHTGVHVSEKLKEICSNFSVSYDKVVAVVHDHGSTVPFIYNSTFTCVYTHGTTQYLASKNPWFAVENFFSTRRAVASRMTFHDTSLGISTTRVISTRRGFPRNESWHLHATCMTVVIHTVIRQTNPPQILLWL